jgi:pantothenate kinase
VPGGAAVEPGHAIVLVEGNYLLLDAPPWAELRTAGLLDETWFVSVSVEEAMARVAARQVANGAAPAAAAARVAANDRPNAELVAATARHARVLVPSDVPLCGGGAVNA